MFCPEDAQVIGTVQQPQSGQLIQRHQDPHRGIDEPPEPGQQRQGATGWPEGHVERAKQGQQPRLVDQVAGDPDTEEPLVRQDVAGSLRWIAVDHQALVDTKVHRHHDREGEQIEESRHSCSFALRLVDGTGRHSVPPRNRIKLCA